MRRCIPVLLSVSLLGGLPGGVGAQVPFTALGLGYPVAPVDARVAALGSTGVGFLGNTFSLRNPAELTNHPTSAVSVTLAPEGAEVKAASRTNDTGRSRVPIVRAVVKLGNWAAGVGFGSELDQDFEIRFQDTLATSVGRFPFEEVRIQDGGVSVIDFSLARTLGPLSAGVGVERLTGSLRRSFSRRFSADIDGSGDQLSLAGDETRLSYGAWRVKGGLSVNVADRFMAGGAIGYSGDLSAEVDTSSSVGTRRLPEDRSFSMPASLEFGASFLPRERILVTAAAGWMGWSRLEGELGDTAAEDTRWVGGGVEWVGLKPIGIFVPLRLGGRFTELPFHPAGSEQPTERAVTMGLGTVFRNGLAELNAALEFGKRGDVDRTGLEETFQRFTLSFVLRQ
ncbi:MAG: hypothetical protein ACE5HP_05055 [Gemmatimonadota bacterium]